MRNSLVIPPWEHQALRSPAPKASVPTPPSGLADSEVIQEFSNIIHDFDTTQHTDNTSHSCINLTWVETILSKATSISLLPAHPQLFTYQDIPSFDLPTSSGVASGKISIVEGRSVYSSRKLRISTSRTSLLELPAFQRCQAYTFSVQRRTVEPSLANTMKTFEVIVKTSSPG